MQRKSKGEKRRQNKDSSLVNFLNKGREKKNLIITNILSWLQLSAQYFWAALH
jgi:hypothetical protein